MSTIIFPSNPSDGQLFPPESIPGVKQYKWDEPSLTWKIVSETGESTFSLTVEENVGLSISGPTGSKVLSTVYNTITNDDVESVEVGGAGPLLASDWKTKTLVEVLDTILFPTLYPNYVIPEIDLEASESGVHEVGEPLTQTLTLTGIKNDSGIFTNLTLTRGITVLSSVNNPVGADHPPLPNQFSFDNENNPNRVYSLVYEDSIEVAVGQTTWSGSATYSSGLGLQTNKGETDDRSPEVRQTNAPQLGSTFSSNSASITGIHPFFWGKSSSPVSGPDIAAVIESGQATKVVESSNGTIEANFLADEEYIWFAHPATAPSKTEWYLTELNQGEISETSFISPPVNENVTSPDGFWENVPYLIYISNYPSSTVPPVQLRSSEAIT